MDSNKERAHREALEACEKRAAVVKKAVRKLLAYIDAHPENPVFLNHELRRIETLRPIVRVTEES
jgi:hypothetical protein